MTEKTEKLKNREKKISKTGAASKTRAVVDVEADQGGGGSMGDSCIKIRYRLSISHSMY